MTGDGSPRRRSAGEQRSPKASFAIFAQVGAAVPKKKGQLGKTSLVSYTSQRARRPSFKDHLGDSGMRRWLRALLLPFAFGAACIRLDEDGRIPEERMSNVVIDMAAVYGALLEDRPKCFEAHLHAAEMDVVDAVLWDTSDEGLVEQILADSLLRWVEEYVKLWEKAVDRYAHNIFLYANWIELAAQPSAYEISTDMWDKELERWRDVNVALNADQEVVDFVSEKVDETLSTWRDVRLGRPLRDESYECEKE